MVAAHNSRPPRVLTRHCGDNVAASHTRCRRRAPERLRTDRWRRPGGGSEGVLERVRSGCRRRAAALLRRLLGLLLSLLDLEPDLSLLVHRALELLALGSRRHGEGLVARGIAALNVATRV